MRGRDDSSKILAAIRTRLFRKLLPAVSADGLILYGLQLSTNSKTSGKPSNEDIITYLEDK